jgi:hypothetical protein
VRPEGLGKFKNSPHRDQDVGGGIILGLILER